MQTLSATDPKKVTPIILPPMQMSAIPQTTAQRLANLQSGGGSPSGVNLTRSATTAASSRATSQTISSMQKQTYCTSRWISFSAKDHPIHFGLYLVISYSSFHVNNCFGLSVTMATTTFDLQI